MNVRKLVDKLVGGGFQRKELLVLFFDRLKITVVNHLIGVRKVIHAGSEQTRVIIAR
jgi:hypothetical protein